MPRNILIAGGNSGTGLELVKWLRQQDDTRVFCAVRHPGPLEEMDDVETFAFEATDPETDLRGMPDTLDGFVYCPGSITLKPFHRLTD
ncbi:MAG: oxidoreductase, partial [Verrucomicrobiae bacterium]|nr:oxidoreductase [Verrucomicrobiae bacterium]